MDCIERESLLKEISEDIQPLNIATVFRHIHSLPAADVAPVVHGKWDDSLDGLTPYCSVCGCSHRSLVRTPFYRPHCGAKMDLEE